MLSHYSTLLTGAIETAKEAGVKLKAAECASNEADLAAAEAKIAAAAAEAEWLSCSDVIHVVGYEKFKEKELLMANTSHRAIITGCVKAGADNELRKARADAEKATGDVTSLTLLCEAEQKSPGICVVNSSPGV